MNFKLNKMYFKRFNYKMGHFKMTKDNCNIWQKIVVPTSDTPKLERFCLLYFVYQA